YGNPFGGDSTSTPGRAEAVRGSASARPPEGPEVRRYLHGAHCAVAARGKHVTGDGVGGVEWRISRALRFSPPRWRAIGRRWETASPAGFAKIQKLNSSTRSLPNLPTSSSTA